MTSWSYSSFSAAVKCLQYYKYVYIDKLKPEVPESGDLAFGSALHSAINASLTNEDAEAIFNLYWDSYEKKEIEYGRFKWAELKELGLNFISKFERLHKSKYNLQHAEKRLFAGFTGAGDLGPDAQLNLEGTPDFIGQYREKRALLDFKTSGYNYPHERARTSLQLYLYSYLAIQSLDFKPEIIGYTVFNKGAGSIQQLTWEFKEEDMLKALDNMAQYCSMIDMNTQHPRNYNNCLIGQNKCPYFEVCHGAKDK